jgi:aldehyde dehydrogenase (NAD(P)+)
VLAARAALNNPSWRDLGASERGKLLYRLAELVESHRDTLATIETWDNGKPFAVARDEDLTEVAETLRYYAGWADKVFGQVIDTTPDKFAYTIREPVGVCGQIIPFVSSHFSFYE